MEKCLIVAAADDNAIGVRGMLPWHISEDLKYFKRQTSGFPVIMGRTTFESLGRPLPARKNIVMSRRGGPEGGAGVAGGPGPASAPVVRVASVEEAYRAAEPAGKCFVIGGASVYAALLGEMDRLYVTRVHTVVPDADAFFPEIDPMVWKEESRSEMMTDEKTGIEFEFIIYVKR